MTIDEVAPERCCGCSACFNICPVLAIRMAEDEEGFKYPQIDEQTCINCGKCARVCPALNEKVVSRSLLPSFYAVCNRQEEVRQSSSSGGVFSVLAEDVLADGGAVYGAAFDDKNHLRHVRVDRIGDLAPLTGSKYVQSEIGTIFSQVRADLKDGRKVLFSGTPCQVAGLYAFLGGDDANLLTADVLCHGVPSPAVFERYLESLGVEEKCRIEFRNKSNGWKKYDIVIGDSVHETFRANTYMKGFLSNLYLRPSCASCPFVGCQRQGDLTLGDFWGAGNFRKRYDDDKGTSLVLLNSPKAQSVFEALQGKFSLADRVPVDCAVPFNPTLCHSSQPDTQREAFFADFKSGLGWNELAAKYIKTETPPRRKVGILNLQHTNNFGACLVAYALQKAVERCGSKAQVINYRPEKKARPFSGAFWRERAAGRNFEKFRRKFLNLTRECRDFDDLSELNTVFDTFVVGSDQVWRLRYVYRFLKEYLLEFAAAHKTLFSYAASFGLDIWEGNDEATEIVERNLHRFNRISVREASGVDICRDMFGVPATQVPDPTLLLTAADYEPIIREAQIGQAQPYVAKMILDETAEISNDVNRLAEKNGLAVVDIYGERKIVDGKEVLVCRPVGEWLKLLQNATYVITDSFHCVCFSLIFRKQFTCVVNPERGVSRLDSLLGLLNLRHRLTESLRNVQLDDEGIDYQKVEALLQAEQKKAYAYLADCLSQPGKEAAPRKEIRMLYLCGIFPLLKKTIKGGIEITKLLNIIPLMKIKQLPAKRKYYLGGVLPLLTLKCKNRKS